MYPRKAAAKDAGVSQEGSGSHRIVMDSGIGSFTDPDGFVWKATARVGDQTPWSAPGRAPGTAPGPAELFIGQGR